jgi:hypothetical protein
MGVSMYYQDSSFKMKKENYRYAVEALDRYRGSPMIEIQYVSYVDGFPGDEKATDRMAELLGADGRKLCEYFRILGFNVDVDNDGNIADLVFDGTKLLKEHEPQLRTIAKYVEKGSYLDMYSADEGGCHWRWYFNGDTMVERGGKIVYE